MFSLEETTKLSKRVRTEDDPVRNGRKSKLESQLQTRPTRVLSSFKQYMKEKNLKGLTRAQLEEFCLQKMCECFADKSELVQLRRKVRTLEEAIDGFRKEADDVASRLELLKITHEKIAPDLKLMAKNRESSTAPLKITRSVALQAGCSYLNRTQPAISNVNCHNGISDVINNSTRKGARIVGNGIDMKQQITVVKENNEQSTQEKSKTSSKPTQRPNKRRKKISDTAQNAKTASSGLKIAPNNNANGISKQNLETPPSSLSSSSCGSNPSTPLTTQFAIEDFLSRLPESSLSTPPQQVIPKTIEQVQTTTQYTTIL